MLAAVDPLLHENVLMPLTVKVALAPLQIAEVLGTMVALGGAMPQNVVKAPVVESQLDAVPVKEKLNSAA